MRFSDYVVLGSTFMGFDPSVYLEPNCGCFIGMAVAAKTGLRHFTLPEFKEVFPWIFKRRKTECPVCHEQGDNYSFSLSCLAVHVSEGTVEFNRALEYIQSVEPLDDIDRTGKTAIGMLVPEQKIGG